MKIQISNSEDGKYFCNKLFRFNSSFCTQIIYSTQLPFIFIQLFIFIIFKGWFLFMGLFSRKCKTTYKQPTLNGLKWGPAALQSSPVLPSRWRWKPCSPGGFSPCTVTLIATGSFWEAWDRCICPETVTVQCLHHLPQNRMTLQRYPIICWVRFSVVGFPGQSKCEASISNDKFSLWYFYCYFL